MRICSWYPWSFNRRCVLFFKIFVKRHYCCLFFLPFVLRICNFLYQKRIQPYSQLSSGSVNHNPKILIQYSPRFSMDLNSFVLWIIWINVVIIRLASCLGKKMTKNIFNKRNWPETSNNLAPVYYSNLSTSHIHLCFPSIPQHHIRPNNNPGYVWQTGYSTNEDKMMKRRNGYCATKNYDFLTLCGARLKLNRLDPWALGRGLGGLHTP